MLAIKMSDSALNYEQISDQAGFFLPGSNNGSLCKLFCFFFSLLNQIGGFCVSFHPFIGDYLLVITVHDKNIFEKQPLIIYAHCQKSVLYIYIYF